MSYHFYINIFYINLYQSLEININACHINHGKCLSSVVIFNLMPTRWTCNCTSVYSINMTDHGKCSSSVVIFNLMPTRWTCNYTSVYSINMTDHGKCSSSVVIFNLIPTRWTCNYTSVYSINMTDHGKCSSSVVINLMTHTERVLYFNFSTLNSHTTEKYLRKCDCSCEPNKLCAELIESETRTLLLLDVGRTDQPGDYSEVYGAFNPILCGYYSHITIIMAQSSGRGGVFNTSQVVKAMNFSTPHKVRFENFTVEEAQTLCKYLELEEKYDVLTNKTNNNPLLLRIMSMTASSKNWIEHAEGTLRPIIQDYVIQTFELLETIDKRHFTAEACNLTPYFLRCSMNGAKVSIDFLHLFLVNFVYLEGLCYIPNHDVMEEGQDFAICSAFPGVEQIVAQKVVSYMICNNADDMMKIPQVLGFSFQLKFYGEFCKIQTMKIMYKTDIGDQQLLLINTSGCYEILSTEMHGFLFNLPLIHPAIDYVSFFKVSGISWLIFFQISLSPYVCHGSKYKDIDQKYPKSELFKDCTILEYYTDYFHTENVLFVYFSPKEIGIPSSLEKHAKVKLSRKVHIGYIVEDHSCLLTQLKRNADS